MRKKLMETEGIVWFIIGASVILYISRKVQYPLARESSFNCQNFS